MRKIVPAAFALLLACVVGACSGLTVKATYQYPAPAEK